MAKRKVRESKVLGRIPESATEGHGQEESPAAVDAWMKQMKAAQEKQEEERAAQEARWLRGVEATEKFTGALSALAVAVTALANSLGDPRPRGASPAAPAASRPARAERAPAEEGAPEVPLSALQQAAVALAAFKSGDAVFEVLGKFGVQGLSALKPEQRQAALDALLKAAK